MTHHVRLAAPPRPSLSSEAAVKRAASRSVRSPLQLWPPVVRHRPFERLAYLSAAGCHLGLAPAKGSGVQVKVPHSHA